MTTAFDSIDLSGTPLRNRIAMAPMTRSRAAEGGLATDLTAAYYVQRASAGLIVTEGIQPSVVGQGYPDTPGLHSADQIAAWRKVTDAVHAAGGTIFAQLMHAGRVGHPVLLPDGLINVGPSPVAADGQVYTAEGPKDFITPHELTDAEIRATVADFATAARNAVDAGFDGVELHGANGYLIHQFLAPGSNRRTDAWGGSPENRVRFAVAVASAVAEEIGASRTGFRVSPGNPANGVSEPDPEPEYTALAKELGALGLAYLHVVEVGDIRDLTVRLRQDFGGTLVLNPHSEGPTGPDALALVEDGTADIVAFGALFLANPDLPARLKAGGPYNTPDRATYYGGTEKGYTDYPSLTQRP
ncbi:MULTISPECIES: alkene reductase [unclassified Streptomyces]|uniref:alkene reductase n=1 Tax=unclassified Streptomyces TaxID=2593676 RepID=UPI00136BB216|nr:MULTISPECIES: alkene reductase [unclassified Streptomyces]NDZ99958.1 alkene reductase [Streptomyces sp. SID10116]MYY81502.1 alkene reductase [Streptomyces sp. SID335]MYZ18856.1 alkene reductase [Streptomyces sp. SID337]NDZ87157.1 alkene reductase [Streptomyces sp. SID10115]NEB48595.1 alkene reductase [Streptomyces sp. SID339]